MFRRADGCDSGTCVEVDTDFIKAAGCEATSCVEVDLGLGLEDKVLVRDSKDPDGPVLKFTREEWIAFIGGAKNGEFDVE